MKPRMHFSLIFTFFLAVSIAVLPALPEAEKADAGSVTVAAQPEDLGRYEEPSVLAELIASEAPEHLLIDVRTTAEYSGGHIPTSVNIPVDDIKANPPQIDKDQLVIVYCRSGNRSGRAARILRDLGFSRVVDFGGINRWNGDLVTGG